MRKIGQAKAGLAADYAAQLARNVGKVVFFAKHIDVMDAAEELFAKRGIGYASIRGDQTPKVRKANIEAFLNDPDVAVVVCSLTAAGVGLNLQVASNVVLAELSWTAAEQTQAIDRVHRIGQTEPVTAWRIIAAQTIDPRIAELIDDKAGLSRPRPGRLRRRGRILCRRAARGPRLPAHRCVGLRSATLRPAQHRLELLAQCARAYDGDQRGDELSGERVRHPGQRDVQVSALPLRRELVPPAAARSPQV